MVEYVTRTFECPDIRTQMDAEIIRETLANASGIDDCQVDVPARSVTVRFVEALNDAALRGHLRDAGFPAEIED